MISHLIKFACAWCVLAYAGGVLRAAGSQASLSAGVRGLYDAAAKNTPPAVAAARAEYDRLKKSHPKDPRIDYAFGVALSNQRKYRDALPLLARYTAEHPDDLAAGRVYLWTLVQDRRYRQALDEATRLGQLVKQVPADQQAQLAETAHLVGVVFGYFDLVRPAAADVNTLPERKQQVLAGFAKDQLAEFDAGRHAVATQLDAMQSAREDKSKREQADAEKRRVQVKAALADAGAELTAGEQDAQASADQLRDAQRELGVIRMQLSSLQNDRSQLAARITVVQTQLLDLQQQAGVAPGVRSQVNPGTAAQATNLNVTLAALGRQSVEVDRRILALQTRAAELGLEIDDEAQALDKNNAAIHKNTKRAQSLERRSRQLEATPSAKVAPLTAEMTRFSTYLPFPYEAERKRVLGWFEK